MNYDIAIQKRNEAHTNSKIIADAAGVEGWRRLTARQAAGMTQSNVPAYFMSKEIVRVIEDAADGLPDVFSLLPDDTPTPTGFMFIEGGMEVPKLDVTHGGERPWDAFAWGHNTEPVGVTLPATSFRQAGISKGRAGLAMMDFCTSDARWHIGARSNLYPVDATAWPWGMSLADKSIEAADSQMDIHTEAEHDETVVVYERMMRLYATAFMFMRQKILVPHREPTSRGERRRAKREGREPEDVFVIRLRAREAHVRAAESSQTTEWARRWIVRGHWRNQWYPSLNMHQPKWIGPYIKGPDGKPLVEPEKMFAVVS